MNVKLKDIGAWATEQLSQKLGDMTVSANRYHHSAPIGTKKM